MRTGSPRQWTVGGALAAVAMLAIGWFFFIGPQSAEQNRLASETAATRARVAPIEHRLAELRKQNTDLAQYQAQRDRDRQALPTTSGLSDFLREMQTAGESTGVSVRGLTIGAPTVVTAGDTQIHALTIALTATGTAAKLHLFLDRLQQVQPRAVLISSVSLAPNDQSGSLASSVSLTLNLQVFVAPPKAAAKAPAVPVLPAPAPAGTAPGGVPADD